MSSIFYSATTRGFYSSSVSTPIPEDAIEITAEHHASLLAGQSQGREIRPGANGVPELAPIPGPTLASRRADLAAYRYQRQAGGITVSGISVPTDRESSTNITAAVVSLTQGLLTAPIRWKMTSGWVDLSQPQILGIGAAVAQHVQWCFEAESEVSAALAADLALDIEAAFDAVYAALAS